MSIKIDSSRNITNVSAIAAIDPEVRLQIATSVFASDFELIKCRLKIKESSRNITNVSAIDPKSDFKWQRAFVRSTSNVDCNLKLKKYYKRVSCIYPKDRLQMATRVCVSDLIQIDQMSIIILSLRNITNASAV